MAVALTVNRPTEAVTLNVQRGVDGAAATISVGTVSTLDAGQPATVTNSGTSAAAIFDFGLPRGLEAVYENLTIVDSLNKFPDPVAGVITLPANTAWLISGTIDLLGNRLVTAGTVALVGTSSETALIKSTGLAPTQWLLTTTHVLPIRYLAFEHTKGISAIAGDPTYSLDWGATNILNADEAIAVSGYNNFVMVNSALLNSHGITFDGSMGSVVFDTCFFQHNTGTMISLPATLTLSRRFRMQDSAMVLLGSMVGINADVGANIPNTNYRLENIAFDGTGTATTGITFADARARFTGLSGLGSINNALGAGYTMTGNATATPIASSGVAYKVEGITTGDNYSQSFMHTNNRLTCISNETKIYDVSVDFGVTSGNNNRIGTYVVLNGNPALLAQWEKYVTTNASGRIESGHTQARVLLANGDYIEIWTENDTVATDITYETLTVIIKPE